MVYGDHGGAKGFLIGEENKGMACMFTMMNRARLAVGLQGVGIAERATQQALAYARERKQGAARAIIAYPDVKRMLLTMRGLTGAARAICYATGIVTDPNSGSFGNCETAPATGSSARQIYQRDLGAAAVYTIRVRCC